MTQKTALIFGATGQDGSYLTELLLSKDYKVVGVTRRVSVNTKERLTHSLGHPNCVMVEGDITDSGSVSDLIREYKPQECYNLAAQSHVGTSFKQPQLTFIVNAMGVIYVLDAIRRYHPTTRFYQASTSEMFGKNCTEEMEYYENGSELPKYKYQDENTPLAPTSPYAIAKVAAHHMVDTYRQAYGTHASCGILFNHESPRRGENFVTRKITKWIGDHLKWLQDTKSYYADEIVTENDYIYANKYSGNKFPKLRLGNIDAYRDWGYAGNYVEAMWLMLQQSEPDDYVIATNETHSVREFLDEAFKFAGLYDFYDIDSFESLIVIDPKFYRPSEVEYLCGKATKAEDKLNWTAQTTFSELVRIMVQGDVHGTQTKAKIHQETN